MSSKQKEPLKKIGNSSILPNNQDHKCTNCSLKRRLFKCQFCKKFFCSICSDYFKKDYSCIILNENLASDLIYSCYNCKIRNLKNNNEYEKYINSRKTFNLNINQNIVREPDWVNKNYSCQKCNTTSINKKFICNLCGETLCEKCKMFYYGNKDIYENPFNKSFLQNF
ncbi:hypothetical protein MHBO_003284 [Bonamia ostreae]|uniref:B box-type domain-containing protein n=1 Tax=Bonamia ostreae TaxID=126728 RepID=A0ABV2AQ17_9EUKA